MWVLRNNEIVHLLRINVNLHLFMVRNHCLLRQIRQVLCLRVEELLVIIEVWIVVHGWRKTMAVEECKLMIFELNLRWNLIWIFTTMLTVKWTQLSCCVVGNFANLV